MTEVTGKFVLKCRTTNIATLFDISLFYVYKFYFIYFPQVQHRTAIPRVGVASSTILKNIEGFGASSYHWHKTISILKSEYRNGHS